MVTWPSAEPADTQAIEEESYRILRSRIDLSRLPRFSRDVTERIIYASAAFDYATDLVCDEESLAAAVAALAAGAPVITDAAVTAASITGRQVICKINEPLTQRLARTAGIARAAAAVRLAFGEVGPGAVWVMGGEATALYELLSRGVESAFVIGLPVGFVGAAESKQALANDGRVPFLIVKGRKGGSAMAAAAVNALASEAE